jgi:hypothetical protein
MYLADGVSDLVEGVVRGVVVLQVAELPKLRRDFLCPVTIPRLRFKI